MKGIPELRFKSILPDHLRVPFMIEMDKKSIDRIQIISWLATFMYTSLFLLDYRRWRLGMFDENPVFLTLFYIHASGLLYFIPALVTTVAKERVKKTMLSRGLVIFFTVALMTGNLLGQTFFSYPLYLSLSLYMIYVLVANWTFTMNHWQRRYFNLGCFLAMCLIINVGAAAKDVRGMISIYEGFFFTIIAFLFGTFDYNLRQAKYLEEQELAKEKARIEELELAKSKMYTNLTHEFRTPLTVIAGMAEQIHNNPSQWAVKGSEMIRRNSARILNLVNNVLDLSKLETGAMPVRLVNGDVVNYLRYIIDSFQSYADSRNVRLHFLPDIPELVMDYDPEKSLTIISNLISNAIKYTPDGGDVYIRIDKISTNGQQLLEIRIRDTGIGIPEDKVHLIFDRFYQVPADKPSSEPGTGIGLAIVKELVKLMEGVITIESKVGAGTEFVLRFPITLDVDTEHAQFVPASIKSAVSSWFTPQETEMAHEPFTGHRLRETTSVLVIEDNVDVAEYIMTVLKDEHSVMVERNGKQGVETAIIEVPDLIITDLMMPGMDGYEVCKMLKHDERTSHIPVIMLTAKADREAKIAGLESGADAYIPKPFDPGELLAQIKQLIELRKQLQAHYNSSNGQKDSVASPTSAKEDKFITKVREAIMARIDDASLGIPVLCRAIGMSRTQLHNKLKALTGKSASHFVRSIRLAEAMKLLDEDDLTIAEIAYATGFTDPGYFTRVFHEEFGETPTEYRKRKNPDTSHV